MEVKQRSKSRISLSEAQQRLDKLDVEISAIQPKTDHAATRQKRKLWCFLQELKMECDSSELAESEDVQRKFAQAEEKLSLLRHSIKRSTLDTVCVFIRLGAILLCNLYLTTLFFILAPLRFLHPVLRKLGIQNNKLPLDLWQRFWAFSMSSLLGFRAKLEGFEHVQKFYESGSPVIGTFQHSSSFDLMGLMAYSPLVFKWIAKKSLMYIPMIGWMGYLIGMIFIDRSNREKAIQSMQKAGRQVHKWGRSIAVSPEGTRTPSGQLGQARLRFLPPIDTTKYTADQHDELMLETRRVMLRAMADVEGPEFEPLPLSWHIWSWFCILSVYFVSFVLFRGFVF